MRNLGSMRSTPATLLAMICAVALAAALGGCGSAALPSGADSPPATDAGATQSSGAAVATGTATSGTSTSGTSTSGTSTSGTSTSGTSTSGTSTGPALPGAGRPMVSIGDKNFTEQFILGELYYQALAAEGFNVQLTQNVGTPSVSTQALATHTLDMYPEYLNVLNTQIAGNERIFRHRWGALRAATAWATARGLTLLTPTPFSDTEGIGVATRYAAKHRLRTIEDLRKVATSLTLGAPIPLQTGPGGLPALEQAYGFLPAKVQSVNIGEQYSALSTGDVQAAYVETTDGQLSNPAYTVLRDPRHILGFGNVVPIVSDTAIKAEGPVFVSTINKIDALLTMARMRRLNAEVDLDLKTPTTVARYFLYQHGLPY